MQIDLERLFKLRAAVGRFGEMDVSRWWNTQDVLGGRGAAVYRRGLPRTHFFARVRLVTAVARQRSATIFPAEGIATLWDLPPDVERALAFEERTWSKDPTKSPVTPEFAEAIASPAGDDLLNWLADLGLIKQAAAARVPDLTIAGGKKGVEIKEPISNDTIQLLAAAHARSSTSKLVVPFIPAGLEATS